MKRKRDADQEPAEDSAAGSDSLRLDSWTAARAAEVQSAWDADTRAKRDLWHRPPIEIPQLELLAIDAAR